MRRLKLLLATLVVLVLRVSYLDAQASKAAAGSLQADPQKRGPM